MSEAQDLDRQSPMWLEFVSNLNNYPLFLSDYKASELQRVLTEGIARTGVLRPLVHGVTDRERWKEWGDLVPLCQETDDIPELVILCFTWKGPERKLEMLVKNIREEHHKMDYKIDVTYVNKPHMDTLTWWYPSRESDYFIDVDILADMLQSVYDPKHSCDHWHALPRHLRFWEDGRTSPVRPQPKTSTTRRKTKRTGY